MFHRWGSLPSYQRTRGALQFLATVVHALWVGRAEREPQALIGPGDVNLADEGSRMTFLEQVGETEQYRSVIEADFLAADAGTRRVDERLGREDVRERVRERLEGALNATRPDRRNVVLWPSAPSDVPDEGDAFRVVYLPPDWSPSAPLERWVLDASGGPRVNRNALCLVEPAADRFDAARAAGSSRRVVAWQAGRMGEIYEVLPGLLVLRSRRDRLPFGEAKQQARATASSDG
jgi:hypothetical protein